MYDLSAFRDRVTELYRRADPYGDGHRPTQQDLAEAVGLNRSELSSRLNGLKNARLTSRDVKAIVLTLAEWGAITTQAEALELLALVDCPNFTAAEWQSPPLADLIASPAPTPAPQLPQHSDLSTTHATLPRPLTSFVGRSAELGEVVQLITRRRLVTLTGTGGSGKTRLAIEAAGRVQERFKDGLYFIELASLTDPGLVPLAVAHNLGISEQAGENLTITLERYLQSREILLVLDNCEHLTAAVAELAHQLLNSCLRLHILATSREVLHVYGELTRPVPPLDLPPREAAISVASLSRYEAVQLFVERAQTIQPSFRLAADNVAAVHAICRQLDGIPLAIELAVARLRVLSLTQIVSQLANRFQLLTDRARGVQPRHQTLRALIDWSYNLLSDSEQALLRQLAVFSGGFTLEAIATALQRPSLDLLDELTELLNKSLLQQQITSSEEEGNGGSEESRFNMLETIREYALLKLDEAGEAEVARFRHASYFLSLAETAEAELHGANQAEWLNRLEREHDNYRAALGWAFVHQPTIGAHIATVLGDFWHTRGYFSEGRRWLQQALAVADVPTAVRAKAYTNAAVLANDQDEHETASQLQTAALALWREVGDKRGIADALNSLGILARMRGDYSTARGLYRESLAIDRELDDKYGVGTVLHNLGLIARMQGDYYEAEQAFRESLAARRQANDHIGVAYALYGLGLVMLDSSRFDEAAAMLNESMAVMREFGNRQGMVLTTIALGGLAYHQCQFATARELFQQGRAISRELGSRMLGASATGRLGDVAYAEGDYQTARQLAEESLAELRQIGDSWQLADTLLRAARAVGATGDYEAAQSLCVEALPLVQQVGDRYGICRFLETMAMLVAAQGQALAAVRLWGAAEAIRLQLGLPFSPATRALMLPHLEAARARLGAAAFATAWDEGRIMSADGAVEYALAQMPGPVAVGLAVVISVLPRCEEIEDNHYYGCEIN